MNNEKEARLPRRLAYFKGLRSAGTLRRQKRGSYMQADYAVPIKSIINEVVARLRA